MGDATNNYFERFTDGMATRKAEDVIWDIFEDESYNPEEIVKAGETYIKSFDGVAYVKDFLGQLYGLPLGEDESYEASEVLHTVKREFEKNGYEQLEEDEESFFKRCLVKETIPADRELMYKICFKLGFDEKTTGEFFFKAALRKPYMVKNISEAVYLFCLKNKKSYDFAQSLIEEFKSLSASENSCPDDNTVAIQNAIVNLTTPEQLKEYIQQNKAGFLKYNTAAIAMIKEICNEAAPYVKEDLSRIYEYGMETTDDDVGDNKTIAKKKRKIEKKYDTLTELLFVILGYNDRVKENGKDVYVKKIPGSYFPNLVKTNFPQVGSIQTFFKDGLSNEIGRKTLILFEFYYFFSSVKEEADDSIEYNRNAEYYFEFIDQMDAILNKVGYVSMYLKHPFDWMIAYCARSAAPLTELQRLVAEFYSDKEEFYQKLE